MKVLIADDNQEKVSQIVKLIENECIEIAVASSTTDVIAKTKHNSYDLLILDLVIPKRYGVDEARVENSIELLKDFSRSDKVIRPAKIVGLTVDLEAYTKGNSEFSAVFTEVIQYDISSQEWRDNLLTKIQSIKNEIPTYLTRNAYTYDFAIIAALSNPELEAVKSVFSIIEQLSIEGDSSFYYNVKLADSNLKVLLATNDTMGMVGMAQLTEKVIQIFRPKNVCMAGIAAGVAGEVEIGDIMLAESSWNYDSGKFISGDFQPDFHPISIDTDLKSKIMRIEDISTKLFSIKEKFRGNKPSGDLRLKIGPLASGSAVVADSSILGRAKSMTRKLIGIEMEIYGMYYSCANTSSPRPKKFLAAKSVCDFADENKHDGYQEYAAYTSANFIKLLIEEGVFY